MAYTNYFRLDINEWTFFELLWLVIFTLVNVALFFAWDDTLIGLIASLTGMLCVILVAKGKISNYSYGFVNILLYSYIAYQSKLYGEVMLNMLYFFPMQFVGIALWNQNKRTVQDVRVRHLTQKELLAWCVVSIIGIYVYGLLLLYLGGNLPFIDSTTTILSIVAMILMVKRALEQWLLWIVVDIVSIGMWIGVLMQGSTDVTMVVMWSAYLVNAIYGYCNWRHMERMQDVNARVVSGKICPAA